MANLLRLAWRPPTWLPQSLWPAPPDSRKETCSDRCRAELGRRWGKDALRARDDEIRALLEAALKTLKEEFP